MENLKERLQTLFVENDFDTLTKILNDTLNNFPSEKETLELCRDYYEKIGDINGAVKSINLLIRFDRTNTSLIFDLANYYQLLGNMKMFEKNIIKCIRLQPENQEFYIQLEDYYKSIEDKEKLVQLYSEAYKKTKNKIFETKLKNLINKTPVTVQDNQPETLSDVHLVDFLNLFEGLKNIYARQWATQEGKGGYTPVREPFTIEVLKRHLYGSITAGIYPISDEGKVKFIAFDMDVRKFAQQLFINDEDYKKKVLSKMQATAKEIIAILNQYSIPAYLEFSGFKGYHIWVFFKDWISAVAAKQFGKKILSLLSFKNEPFNIEFFPKQTKATSKNPGNLIKLPLGIHLKNRKRSYFLDYDFKKIPPDRFISDVVTVEEQTFYNALKNLPETLTSDEIAKISKKSKTSKKSEKPEFSDQDKFILENDVKFQWIYNKCYAIRKVIEKINTVYELTNNEIIVLKYTFGHFENGPDIVNALLKKCVNVKKEQFMKSPFKGSPISCVKIQHRLAGLISLKKCNCEFPHLINYYPNPLAHLEELPFANDENKTDKLKIRIMIENYMRLKKEITNLNEELRKTEKDLIAFLKDVEVSDIDTSFGKVHIKIENENLAISIKV